MSKLDQLRALGEARAAIRGNIGRRRTKEVGKAGAEPIEQTKVARRPSLTAHGLPSGVANESKRSELNPEADKPDGRAKRCFAPPNRSTDELPTNISRSSAPPNVAKRGRPRITAPRPWDSEGMSKRTWYRRQAEKRENEK